MASLFEIEERVVARPLRWVAPVVEIDRHHRLQGGAAEEVLLQSRRVDNPVLLGTLRDLDIDPAMIVADGDSGRAER